MKRKIISINEDLCDGCGNCIPNCDEGALQIIDGKARLISDLFCDGLGACLGNCPTGAMTLEEREAEPYDERKVMETLVEKGDNVIKAHLKHLKEHGEFDFFNQAIEYLKENNIENPLNKEMLQKTNHSGCPGKKEVSFKTKNTFQEFDKIPSALSQWPVQLHLLNPYASYFKNADLLISADCVAHAYGNFHNDFLKGKVLAVACPKLDSNQESYIEKLITMIDDAKINTITVIIMEVPCCGGLTFLVQKALEMSHRKVPVKKIVISIQGKILSEEWI
jgi:ferredoxin